MNPILRRVREVIRESRSTQSALEKAKVASQSAISAWFTKDDSEPSATALAQLARHLGINGHWLLTGEGEKRTMGPSGADAVFEAGIAKGLQFAQSAIAELRDLATSTGEYAHAQIAATVQKVAEDVLEYPASASPRRPRGRRRKGGER